MTKLPSPVALKADDEKIRMELLSPVALEAIAKVMTFGAQKYTDHNWRKGFKWSRLIGAALRHLMAFMKGEDKDPESGLPHLAHLGCCVMFLLEHQLTKIGKDDRYKGELNDTDTACNGVQHTDDPGSLPDSNTKSEAINQVNPQALTAAGVTSHMLS